MFKQSARFYDLIYSGQNIETEVELLNRLIEQHKQSSGKSLLDVACGTGRHISFLKKHYESEGLDLNAGLLEMAQKQNPELIFHTADMLDFQLLKQFDVIICMFSAIGYMKTVDNLRRCIRNMCQHLKEGGVLIIEPWFSPTTWKDGSISTIFVDQPDLKIVRMNVAKRKDSISVFDPHYLIATDKGVEDC